MKKVWSLILVVMLCLLAPLPLLAVEKSEEPKELGFWFEGRAVSNGSSSIVGWYELRLIGKLGFYVLGEVENSGYRQMYAGPTLQLLPWLQIGAGVGAEHVPDELTASNTTRTNVFVAVDTEKFYSFITFENGGSGSWHRVHALYRVTGNVAIGAMDETDLGFGPRVEYNIKKNVTAWVALLHDRNEQKSHMVFAINFSF